MAADFGAYLRELRDVRTHPEATPELSLRQALITVLREGAGAGLTIFGEVTTVEGQPDIIVKRGPLVVGYGETKPPGTMHQLEAVLDTPQLAAYRRLPNLLLTDYLHFILLRDGGEVRRASLISTADLDAGHLTHTDRGAAEEVLSAWLSAEPAQITSSERLAIELARRAAWLRDGIRAELRREAEASAQGHEDGPLRSLARFYRDNLMSDLDDDGFADAFAQTVAYGLFVGRYHLTSATFDRASAIDAIPASTSFLRSATRFLLDETTVPRGLSWIIDDIVAVLRSSADALVRQAGTVKAAESDAVIHFYESFLAAYDAGERIDRGIYYTHPPLVEYAVRATDDALASHFGFDGLADGRVRLLDPAVGTGTFLVGVAERAIARVKDKEGTALVPALIAEHLLPHLYGFELLPAPYAICHLKLSSFYEQQGRPLADTERANVFLTNTLADPITPTGGVLPAIGALVTETRRADEVKAETPLLVVIGNPPYSVASHNHEHIGPLMADFFSVDGQPLDERNVRPLDDDYLRFLRWSVWKLLEQPGAPGRGIIAMVTNSAYLSRPVTRGVRQFLLDRFDEIRVLDLHGNQRDWFRDRTDEKVFPQVQVGIAITLFIRRDRAHPGRARVFYRETRGTAREKYDYLAAASLGDAACAEVEPASPQYSFIAREVDDAYESWPRLSDLMPVHSPGVISHRDRLSVGFDDDDLIPKIMAFADTTIPDVEVQERFGLLANDRWQLHARRTALGGIMDRSRVKPLLFRPFDPRVIYDETNLVGDRREPLRAHLERVEGNVALVSARSATGEAAYAFATRVPGTQALLSSRTMGAAVYFPLFLAPVTQLAREDHLLGPTEHEQGHEVNFAHEWFEHLRAAYGGTAMEGALDGAKILGYIYAILASATYRKRFGAALADEFPRIPFTADRNLFWALSKLGALLLAAHLGELHPLILPRLEGAGDLRVGGDVHHDPGTQRLYVNATQYLSPVPAGVWAARIGSYQPLDLWLRNRVGRTLSRADIRSLGQIVGMLAEAADKLAEIEPLVGEVLDGDVLAALED
jgi:hypothetical protein